MPRWLVLSVMGLLVLLGVSLAAFGLAIRSGLDTSKVEQTSAPGRPMVTVTTQTPPSDAFITAVLGAATVLVLVGAFYPRVTRIPVPGTNDSIDVTPVQIVRAAEAVEEQLKLHPDIKLSAARVTAATLITARMGGNLVQEALGTGGGLGIRRDVPPDAARDQASDAWSKLAELTLTQLGSSNE